MHQCLYSRHQKKDISANCEIFIKGSGLNQIKEETKTLQREIHILDSPLNNSTADKSNEYS